VLTPQQIESNYNEEVTDFFSAPEFLDAPAAFGLVVGLSVGLSMLIAAAVGTFVPVFLKRLNIDPAIAVEAKPLACRANVATPDVDHRFRAHRTLQIVNRQIQFLIRQVGTRIVVRIPLGRRIRIRHAPRIRAAHDHGEFLVYITRLRR